MRRTLDRFESRLRAELHEEFDPQVVDTPPPQRARYGRLREPRRRAVPLRTATFVTAVFAVGVLVGLVYDAQHAVLPSPGRILGVVPSPTRASQTASTTTSMPQTASPATRASAPASSRPRPTTPRSTASASAPPALSDDFSGAPVGAGPPAGWSVDDGAWAGVVNDGGHVVRHNGSQPLAHLVTGSPRWTDYSVSADVSTALLDIGFAGVAARYQDPGDDYECGLGGVGAQLQLWVTQAGSRRLLAASTASLDLSTRHRVTLQVRGSVLTCSLDGTPALQATDTTFAAGRIALVASDGEVAEFGAVRVTS